MSFQGYADFKLLLFVWRILLLPVSCVYRQVILARLWYHVYCIDGAHLGPSKGVVETLKKYAMFLNMLVDALSLAGVTPISTMKGLVRRNIE